MVGKLISVVDEPISYGYDQDVRSLRGFVQDLFSLCIGTSLAKHSDTIEVTYSIFQDTKMQCLDVHLLLYAGVSHSIVAADIGSYAGNS